MKQDTVSAQKSGKSGLLRSGCPSRALRQKPEGHRPKVDKEHQRTPFQGWSRSGPDGDCLPGGHKQPPARAAAPSSRPAAKYWFWPLKRRRGVPGAKVRPPSPTGPTLILEALRQGPSLRFQKLRAADVRCKVASMAAEARHGLPIIPPCWCRAVEVLAAPCSQICIAHGCGYARWMNLDKIGQDGKESG